MLCAGQSTALVELRFRCDIRYQPLGKYDALRELTRQRAKRSLRNQGSYGFLQSDRRAMGRFSRLHFVRWNRPVCRRGDSFRCRTLNRSFSPLSFGFPLLAPQRDIIPAVAQRFRHPNELVQEFVGALDKRLIEKVARWVEYAGDIAEIDVPKNVD